MVDGKAQLVQQQGSAGSSADISSGEENIRNRISIQQSRLAGKEMRRITDTTDFLCLCVLIGIYIQILFQTWFSGWDGRENISFPAGILVRISS